MLHVLLVLVNALGVASMHDEAVAVHNPLKRGARPWPLVPQVAQTLPRQRLCVKSPQIPKVLGLRLAVVVKAPEQVEHAFVARHAVARTR